MGWTCCAQVLLGGGTGVGPGTRAEAGDFCRWLRIVGKPQAGGGYAVAAVAHCETVLRRFYDFQLEAGTRPDVVELELPHAELVSSLVAGVVGDLGDRLGG
jgi:hypothetical protein